MMSSTKNPVTDFVPVPSFGKPVVLLFSLITFGIVMGTPASLSVMFLDWLETFQVSRAHTAVVHSTCIGILFGGGIIPGYVMNKFGPRITLLLGAFLATIGLVTSMFSTSIDYLIVSTGVIGGFGFSFLQIPIFPCITPYFTTYKTLVISLCLIVAAVIGIINRYLLQFLIDLCGWRGAYTYLAGITLNSCVGVLIITSTPKPKPGEDTVSMTREVDASGENTSVEEDRESYYKYTEPVDIVGTCIHPMCSSKGCIITTNKDNISSIDGVESSDRSRSCDGITNITKQEMVEKIHKFRISKSKWRFLLDIIFVFHTLHIGVCTASMYSFALIQMDFARSLGFNNSTGVLFLTVVFASSILGRLGVGLVDFYPKLHSIYVHTLVSFPGVLSVILLSVVRERVPVIGLLCLVGVTMGGLVAIYPKCILDMKSVDSKSYSIAFGLTCTVEGIMDLLIPIAIGSSVDATGSYKFILLLLGFASLLTTLLLGTVFYYTNKQRLSVPLKNIHNDTIN